MPYVTPPAAQYPFAVRQLDVAGTVLTYVDEGEGLPVLFCHGNPTWSYLWREVIVALPDGLRCIALDLPGFGNSGIPAAFDFTPEAHAKILGRFLEQLELERVILVGHDWGGPIGLAVILNRIEQLVGLVLSNTWCWPPDLNMRLFSTVMGGAPLGRWLNVNHNFFARWVMPMATHRKLATTTKRAYTEPFDEPRRRMGTWVFPRAIRTSSRWLQELEDKLTRVHRQQVPTELVWGMKDPAFGHQRVLARWLDHLPQARVDRLTDASHYVPEDRPDALVEAIVRIRDAVLAQRRSS